MLAAAIFRFVFLVGFSTVFVLTWYRNKHSEVRKESALDAIARTLGGKASATGWARGRLLGVPVEVRLTTRGSGSSKTLWTEIDVDLPRAYPLSLNVRRQHVLDGRRVSRGDMIDVQLGDPDFDPRFVVEAAPADITRYLLDPQARAFLLRSDRGVELFDLQVEERHVLRFVTQGWLDDVPALETAIQEIANIALRVPIAYAAVADSPPPAPSGGPYRSELKATVDLGARHRREAEVAAVEAMRAHRAMRALPVDAILTTGFYVILFAAIAFLTVRQACCSG